MEAPIFRVKQRDTEKSKLKKVFSQLETTFHCEFLTAMNFDSIGTRTYSPPPCRESRYPRKLIYAIGQRVN